MHGDLGEDLQGNEGERLMAAWWQGLRVASFNSKGSIAYHKMMVHYYEVCADEGGYPTFCPRGGEIFRGDAPVVKAIMREKGILVMPSAGTDVRVLPDDLIQLAEFYDDVTPTQTTETQP